MKPPQRKWPHAKAAGNQPARPAAHARQFKPPVAQTKNATNAPRHPAAPPVYRPQALPHVLQCKAAGPSQIKRPPTAPPVYRPQPAPKVLQTKTAQPQRGAIQRMIGAKHPTAPPAYRPQPTSKVLQTKTAGAPHSGVKTSDRKPVAPPVYRPQPLPRALQAKAVSHRPGVRPSEKEIKGPCAPPAYRPQPVPKVLQRSASRQVIQRTIRFENKVWVEESKYADDSSDKLIEELEATVEALPVLQKTILESLASAATDFKYENELELLNDLQLRGELIGGMGKLNSLIKEKKIDYEPESGENSPIKLPGSHWKGIVSQHPQVRGAAEERRDVAHMPTCAPYAAMKALFEDELAEMAYLDCESAMVSANYWAMAKVMEEEEFNKEFQDKVVIAMQSATVKAPTGTGFMQHPIKSLLVEVTISDRKDLIPGDWVYFQNYPSYEDNPRHGAWSGEYAVYNGSDRFSGFGLQNLTYSQIVKNLHDVYMEERGGGKSPAVLTKDEEMKLEMVDGDLPGISKTIYRNMLYMKPEPLPSASAASGKGKGKKKQGKGKKKRQP